MTLVANIYIYIYMTLVANIYIYIYIYIYDISSLRVNNSIVLFIKIKHICFQLCKIKELQEYHISLISVFRYVHIKITKWNMTSQKEAETVDNEVSVNRSSVKSIIQTIP